MREYFDSVMFDILVRQIVYQFLEADINGQDYE